VDGESFCGSLSGLRGTRHVRRDYNMGIMRFFESRSFARSAPLAAVAVLLCVGVFLPWLGSGPEASSSLTGLHYSQAYQGTNGGGQTPTGTYLAALGDEAKDGDKGPVKARLLTALLVMFWALVVVLVVWLVTQTRIR
jgi:hypothetical protein